MIVWIINSNYRCEGTWGIAVVNRERPNEIIVACNGSPMVTPIIQFPILPNENKQTNSFIHLLNHL